MKMTKAEAKREKFDFDTTCVLNLLDEGQTLLQAVENVLQDVKSAYAKKVIAHFGGGKR